MALSALAVLFQSRKTLFDVPGGDTVQIQKTAEALRSVGCRVDVTTDLEPDLAGYDMVHLFNLMRPQELYLQAMNAKRQKRKVALSTIYVDYTEYDRSARGPLARLVSRLLSRSDVEYLKVMARALKNREFNKGTVAALKSGFGALQSALIEMSDVILPNSCSEMRRLKKDFPQISHKPYIVVPNAVDTALFNPGAPLDEKASRYKGAVLCVARIEGLKNQLNLVRAMKGLPWPLVLIGRPAPNHMRYYEAIKREAGSGVFILGHVEHEDLPGFYRAASVHALASWMETTGLSSLEAGAAGCNLVITDRGDTRDYFGDYAYYCHPGSVGSIREAVIKAHEAPVNPELKERITRDFNWQKTAEMTLKGYETCLKTQ